MLSEFPFISGAFGDLQASRMVIPLVRRQIRSTLSLDASLDASTHRL